MFVTEDIVDGAKLYLARGKDLADRPLNDAETKTLGLIADGALTELDRSQVGILNGVGFGLLKSYNVRTVFSIEVEASDEDEAKEMALEEIRVNEAEPALIEAFDEDDDNDADENEDEA